VPNIGAPSYTKKKKIINGLKSTERSQYSILGELKIPLSPAAGHPDKKNQQRSIRISRHFRPNGHRQLQSISSNNHAVRKMLLIDLSPK
jgi:hypothetical protein